MTEPVDPVPGGGTRILIVDDHGLLAQSLSFALRAQGMQVDRCADMTAEAILAHVQAASAEVVLLDLDVGGELGTTLPLIPAIAASGASVVMLTGVTDRVRLAECVEAGATGVIAKSQPFDDLVEAVRRVAAIGALLTPHERESYLADLRQHRAADRHRLRDFERLTPREAQVLAGLMDGLSAEQIATDWVVSITTVRTQVRGLLTKLGVNSQLAAVALARKTGWQLPE